MVFYISYTNTQDQLERDEFILLMREYNLLPNDALIAATCKHHGIRIIATFDPDFKRVDFLEIITLE
ncbi:MAG: PIN domain-containing protein [Halobacteriota archaeon]